MDKTAKPDFFDRLQIITEAFLTRRNMRRRIKREKQREKNPVIDWIEAFIWAACMVLIINQYFFQAYEIPSGSMIDTLLVKDRIFVNKFIFGPELLPGLAKIPSPIKPKRNDIIIFENPSYISRGTAFDIAQRVIYMLTISLVNIDVDESGDPKAQFLIKRAAGMGKDWFKMRNGDFYIRFAGTDEWISEEDYNKAIGRSHRLSRLMAQEDYPVLIAAGKAAAYDDLNMSAPLRLFEEANRLDGIYNPDYLAYDRARLALLRSAQPDDIRYRTLLSRYDLGWYIPEGGIFPLGDNRDNSRDGRYFGPIRASKALGQGAFIYWPLARIGGIR
ncbi:MAG: signal peptidase I [Treponema sp.]|jgi:signal peptidase I|nr:signal peptidase I [Treponema sp.]